MIHTVKWITSRMFEVSEMSFGEVKELCQKTGKAIICGVEVTVHPETKEISYDTDLFRLLHGDHKDSPWRDTSRDHADAYQEKIRYME